MDVSNSFDVNISSMEANINISAPKETVELKVAGGRGRSAYEVAVMHGYVGTEDEWLDSLKATATQVYQNQYDFPNLGEVGVLYIDKDNNKVYRWDEDDRKYYCVGSDYTDVKVIDGGHA